MAITYTPTTNFGAKDSLPTNDPDKVIKGSEFTTEFTALQTAFSLAAPSASPTFTGTVTIPTADINGGAIDGTTIGGTAPAAATFTSLIATTADINGGNIDGTVIGGATPAAGSFTTFTSNGIDDNASATAVTLDASGNVGIGTASFNSANKLEVTGDINTTWASGVSRFIGMRFGDGSLYEMGLVAKELPELQVYAKHASGAPITFLTGATPSERMRIDSSGNVGIGTTSPSVNLHVSGSLPFQKIDNSAGTSGEYGQKITSNATDLVSFTYSSTTGENRIGGLQSYVFPTFYSGGSERMRLDASGNVGIGTTSPAAKLEINGTTGLLLSSGADTRKAYIKYQGDGALRIGSDAGGTSETLFFTLGTESMRIDSSGNVGIGGSPTAFGGGFIVSQTTGSSGGYSLQSSGSVVTQMAADSTASVGYTGTRSNHPHVFTTNNTERMRIDSSGTLAIGGTNPSPQAGENIAYHVASDGYALYSGVDATTSRNHAVFGNPNGYIGSIVTNGSATAYNTSSDARLKENIADAEDAGTKVDAIQVRQFDWKADGSHQDYGMIAQELLTVAPEAVSGDPESDDMMGVDYSKLVPMMLKEIQSLRARVAQLEGA